MKFLHFIFLLAIAVSTVSCANRAPRVRTATAAAQTASDMPETGATPRKPFLTQSLSAVSDALTSLNPFKKKRPPLALPAQGAGKVRSVNAEHAFALIETDSLGQLQPGLFLYTTGNKQETATLRISTLRHNSFIIADIIEGHPSQGDATFLK